MDESRQVDELLNDDDSTFCWESPASESESAIGHSGSALSGQCSKIGENRGSDTRAAERVHLCHQWDGVGSGAWIVDEENF